MLLMQNNTDWLTYPKAIKEFGISRSIIEQWKKAGKVREYRLAGGGGYPLLKRSELEAAARIVPAEGDQEQGR